MQTYNNIPVWGEPVDESALEQIKRCAKSADRAAMMADHHKGYAVPIGGVVAYEDAISPSGVGYDIACLAAGSRITTRDGYWLPIDEVDAQALDCWDGTSLRKVFYHDGYVARGNKPTIRLHLANGRLLTVTSDHLVQTNEGWKEAGSLQLDSKIACTTHIGLPWQDPMSNHRVGLLQPPLRLNPTIKFGLLEQLATRKLYPLALNQPHAPALIRLLGVICGDGHLAKNGKRIGVYTTNEKDALAIVKDFAAIGYTAKTARRQRNPAYKPELHVYITSTALHALFEALGAPIGRKDWPSDPFPWLFDAPDWVRGQFLSAFLSAECMTPRWFGAYSPNLQVKQAGENRNSIEFIGRLFQSLGFQVSIAQSGASCGDRADYILQVLGGIEEQLRVFETIGFCYAYDKRCAAAKVASLACQRKLHKQNREAARVEARLLHTQGMYWREVKQTVAQKFAVSEGFVHHAIYDDRGALRPEKGLNFEAETCGEIYWVPVTSIEPGEMLPVYDIVTGDDAHNFIAEGCVVHNCGNKAVLLDIPAQEARSNIKSIMDGVWNTLSFGMGRKNKQRVEHELFEDEAWRIKPIQAIKKKAAEQLGTIGGGNHYVDLFEDEQERIWIGVHFGSRGLGHGIATHFLQAGGAKDGMDVDPLVLSLTSDLGIEYLEGMRLAGHYAYAGRDWVCAEVAKMLGATILEEIHNHHNYAWEEVHDGQKLWVVRKGATPAFPGQKGFVGGSMGDISVILEGVESEEGRLGLYSTVHGAGRVMSRTEARGKIDRKTGRVIKEGRISDKMMINWVRREGVELRGGGVDESPHCYKRLPEVLAAHKASIRILHTLTPVGVAMAGADEIDPYKD